MSQFYFIFALSLFAFVNICFSAEPKAAKSQNPTVLIKTNLGDITVELYADKAPISVENFLQYVKEGRYDHTIFHRVIPGFMIQGGGFTKDMQQKTTLAAIQNEADNGLLNEKGTLAMARTSEPNSATGQFFINTANNPFLNFRSKKPSEYGYCVFGKVISGMDVVEKIEKTKTSSKGPHENVPVTPVEILEAKLVSK